MKKIGVKQVLVFLHMSGASGRDMLSGIFNYAKGGRMWSLHLANASIKTSEEVNALIEKGCIKGIIAGEYCLPDAPRLLEDSDIPLVYIGSKGETDYSRTKAISYVHNDEPGIGSLAANTFMKLGRFQSFAFVPARPGVAYSDGRQTGYTQRLADAKAERIEIFEPKAKPGTPDDRADLARWLTFLPKPAAVYVAWDFRAIQVLEACREAKIAVPEHVAVLGTDNDELLCDSAEPPLSSILPDHERAGYVAAERLDALMRGRNPKPQTVFLKAKKVVERETTRSVTSSAHLVGKALAYINGNATKGITVVDVIKHLGCSRRLADLRFKEIAGTTILKAITARRMAELKRLLSETNLPINKVAARSGFTCIKRLERLFKSEEGISMHEWRHQNQPSRH
ncbi:MAG: DNA-binding transcriptional regulator [Kiritimatiellae bacterium]|nr:DNA-binding transcriptional regulator [Kiritimatiellia bacterium]